MNKENELTAALATIEKLRAERDKLASENVALKSAVTQQIELRAKIKNAGRPPHADFWGQSICEAEEKVNLALKGTPYTDRIVAGIKADGVEEFVSNTVHKIFDESGAVSALAYLSLANSHVKQLREGENHD